MPRPESVRAISVRVCGSPPLSFSRSVPPKKRLSPAQRYVTALRAADWVLAKDTRPATWVKARPWRKAKANANIIAVVRFASEAA